MTIEKCIEIFEYRIGMMSFKDDCIIPNPNREFIEALNENIRILKLYQQAGSELKPQWNKNMAGDIPRLSYNLAREEDIAWASKLRCKKLCNCAKGNYKTAGGYKWEYVLLGKE